MISRRCLLHSEHFFLLENISKLNNRKNVSSKAYDNTLKKCYKLLNVSEDSDQETIRRSYLELVKRYHPDSGCPESDADKFREIESAFRILNKKNAQDRWNVDESQRVQEFDIKHTAPQHRQYLSYEGVGLGSPAQRERQWAKARASRAAQNVMEHRVAKASTTDNAILDKNAPKKNKHDIKTMYGFDRLVEDLIQESMSKGEFNNLKGSGKPLPSHQNTNPYVDFVTHKLNEVLIENGFTPEWITLQKEIRVEIETLRSSLLSARTCLGALPLTRSDEEAWRENIEKYATPVKNINSKITHYNLVVPILQKQMFLIRLNDEAEKALQNGKNKHETDKSSVRVPNTEGSKDRKLNNDPIDSGQDQNVVSLFFSIFKL